MFQTITLRGVSASILWGYRSAAALSRWTVQRKRDEVKHTYAWSLTATLGPQVDRFQLRQRPLMFTAPRRGGYWCWPVLSVTVGERTLVAQLGPPEQ